MSPLFSRVAYSEAQRDLKGRAADLFLGGDNQLECFEHQSEYQVWLRSIVARLPLSGRFDVHIKTRNGDGGLEIVVLFQVSILILERCMRQSGR